MSCCSWNKVNKYKYREFELAEVDIGRSLQEYTSWLEADNFGRRDPSRRCQLSSEPTTLRADRVFRRTSKAFIMGGPNLEIFKFSIYLFVPIVALIHFGDPQWYREKVVPYRNQLFPSMERTVQRIPKDQSGIREEIARMKAERIARRAEREAAEAKSTK